MPEHNDFDERLLQRLRAYESRIPDTEVPMTDVQHTRGRFPLAAAAGVTTVGVLAGVLLAFVLLNRPAAPTGESSPSPSESVLPTQSAHPSPSATEGAPSSDATASPPAESPPAEAYSTILLGESGSALGVTSGPSGAVVLGFDETGPTAWFSADGRDWQPAEVPAGLEDMRPTAVVASDRGYVAAMVSCLEGSECFGGELWYSTDGTSWADTGNSIAGGILVHLAAGGPGFVAMAIEPYAAGSPGVTPTVLVSDDGQSWEAGRPSGLSGANVHAMVGAGSQVVALGTQGLEAGGTTDASWTTADGRTWERTDEDSDRAAVYDMAWNGEELLAVGQGSCPDVGLGPQCPGEARLAWRSADGRSWEPVLTDACCGGLSDVIGTGTGWVATVTPGEELPDAPRALAGTTGESRWRAVDFEVDNDVLIESVAFQDGLVLFVGEFRQGGRPQPVIVIANEPLP